MSISQSLTRKKKSLSAPCRTIVGNTYVDVGHARAHTVALSPHTGFAGKHQQQLVAATLVDLLRDALQAMQRLRVTALADDDGLLQVPHVLLQLLRGRENAQT